MPPSSIRPRCTATRRPSTSPIAKVATTSTTSPSAQTARPTPMRRPHSHIMISPSSTLFRHGLAPWTLRLRSTFQVRASRIRTSAIRKSDSVSALTLRQSAQIPVCKLRPPHRNFLGQLWSPCPAMASSTRLIARFTSEISRTHLSTISRTL